MHSHTYASVFRKRCVRINACNLCPLAPRRLPGAVDQLEKGPGAPAVDGDGGRRPHYVCVGCLYCMYIEWYILRWRFALIYLRGIIISEKIMMAVINGWELQHNFVQVYLVGSFQMYIGCILLYQVILKVVL